MASLVKPSPTEPGLQLPELSHTIPPPVWPVVSRGSAVPIQSRQFPPLSLSTQFQNGTAPPKDAGAHQLRGPRTHPARLYHGQSCNSTVSISGGMPAFPKYGRGC
jgi:hypothetical protein